MKPSYKWTIGIGAVLSTVVAGGMQARAASNSIGAFAGHAQSAASESCFGEVYGGVYGECANSPQWEVNVPVNSPGSYWTPTLAVEGGPGAVVCDVVGVDQEVTTAYGTQPQSTAGGGVSLQQFSVWVPENGHFYAQCNIATNGTWYSLNY